MNFDLIDDELAELKFQSGRLKEQLDNVSKYIMAFEKSITHLWAT